MTISQSSPIAISSLKSWGLILAVCGKTEQEIPYIYLLMSFQDNFFISRPSPWDSTTIYLLNSWALSKFIEWFFKDSILPSTKVKTSKSQTESITLFQIPKKIRSCLNDIKVVYQDQLIIPACPYNFFLPQFSSITLRYPLNNL